MAEQRFPFAPTKTAGTSPRAARLIEHSAMREQLRMSAVDARLVSMSTQYYTASSIDGFIADSDNSLSWLFQFSEPSGMEDEFPRFIADCRRDGHGLHDVRVDRGSHRLPHRAEQVGVHRPDVGVQQSGPASRRRAQDIRFVSGDVAQVHEEMVRVADGQNVWLVGGGDLVGQFHDQGLLDEVIIGMASVTLGSGAPLLPRRRS